MRLAARALLTLSLLALPGVTSGQPAQEPPPPIQVQVPGQPFQRAEETRQQLSELLREVPPTVRGGIQLDPSLMGNADYMAPYPRLTAFLQQHPEVGRNPSYFFGAPGFGSGVPFGDPDPLRTFAEMFGATMVTTGVVTFFLVVGSLLQQVVRYRRWVRRARMQTEVHTKILDRLQSNEEVLAYVQTPAGRHFLEFGSPAVEADPGPTRVAPFGRILWSVQAGVVLAALGFGLWLAQRNVPEEVAGALSVLAVVVTAVGVGAIASGGVAYALSSRLGFLPKGPRSAVSPDA